jgi:hypothetical protein
MTDATALPSEVPAQIQVAVCDDDRTRKRNAAEKRFKAYGIGAILIGLGFLVMLACRSSARACRLSAHGGRGRIHADPGQFDEAEARSSRRGLPGLSSSTPSAAAPTKPGIEVPI